IGFPARVMPGRGYIGVASESASESQGVPDLARGYGLVIANQARKDRQTGRVGRAPTRGSERIRVHVEDRPRSRSPTLGIAMGVEKFVEFPSIAIDYQNMPIAFRLRSSFNRSVDRDRIGSG